jgi:hypothetical protein
MSLTIRTPPARPTTRRGRVVRWPVISAALGLSLLGCSDAQPSVAADAGSEVVQGDTPFGHSCTSDAACAPGLFCMQDEFAPFGWCSAPCTTPRSFCDPADLGGQTALCIQMPADFSGRSEPFCAARCQTLAGCRDLAAGWETCEKAHYKNTDRYPELPDKVCMAPSAHGQIKVDPTTCAWEDKVTDPAVQEAKQRCRVFCDFKKACQLFDPSSTPYDCCTWACFGAMTPNGQMDNEYRNRIACFNNSFAANQNTPKVCTAWQTDCEPLGEDGLPAGD